MTASSATAPKHPAAHRNPAATLTSEHPNVVKVGRVGWLAKGIVYVIAGYLAFAIALRSGGWTTSPTTGAQEASPTGAIKTVAGSSGGTLLLIVLAVGLVAYAAWRIVAASMPGDHDAKAWIRRIGYVVSAVIYLSFAVSALALARHTSTSQDGNHKVTDISASVMGHTGGRLVIGLVGVIVVAAGLYRCAKGVKFDVDDELEMGSMSPARAAWTRRLGAVGEVGRGVGIALVGIFLTVSAITYDAGEATGLDGALRRMATHTWGVVVVAVVGVGFVAYGAFCVTTFTHRRLERL